MLRGPRSGYCTSKEEKKQMTQPSSTVTLSQKLLLRENLLQSKVLYPVRLSVECGGKTKMFLIHPAKDSFQPGSCLPGKLLGNGRSQTREQMSQD